MRYLILLITQLIFTFNLLSQNTLYFNQEDALFREGLALLDKSEFGASRQRFEKFINSSDNKVKKEYAEYYVAFCALGLYHSDGEKRIEQFITQHKDHPKAVTAYYEMGNFYFQEKKYKKASEYYSKVDLALVSDEQRQETRYKLGYSFFAERKLSEAVEYFNVLKRQSGSYSAASNYYAGYIEYELKQYDKAIIDLEKAALNEAYASVAPTLLANLYYKQKRYDDLINYGNKVLEKGEANANEKDFYLLLGDAYLMKNDYIKAISFYQLYQQKVPNPANDIRYRIGYANYKESKYDEAIENLKRSATEQDSIGVYSSYYLGVMYLKKGNKLYAVTAFDAARKNKINEQLREEGAYQYAKVTYDLDRAVEAVEAFELYKEQYPKGQHKQEIDDMLSEAYLSSNNYDLAIRHLEEIGKLNFKLEKVYQKATYLKGAELFNKGDYKLATDMFKKSLRYPIDLKYAALANLWSAEAYAVGRRYDQALPHYRAILNNSEMASGINGLRARYGIGYAYYNTEVYDKALIHFKEYVNALENMNDKMYYNDALLRLADCYYVRKSYSDAIIYYNKALKNTKTDQDYAQFQLGTVYGIQNNVEAAIKSYDWVINQPKSRYFDDAIFQKAQLHFEKGNFREAVNGFSKLIEVKSSSKLIPYAYLKRASSFYNLKQFKQSIEDYKIILTEFPSHSVAAESLLPFQEVLNIESKGDEFDGFLAAYKKANPNKNGLEGVEFESAKNQYFNLNYKKAIERFKIFIESYPTDSRIAEAKYFTAESYYRLKDYEPALTVYNELVGNTSFEQNTKIVARIAEIEYLSGRYNNAIYFYSQLEDVAASKKEQYNAWVGLMESYYLLGKYDSVDQYAKIILEKGNVHISSQNKASLYLGKSAFARGNYDQAQDEFITTLNSARDEFGAEAQYTLGLIYFNKKDYQKSIETLIDLNNNFNLYTEWVGKGYMLLADNYLSLDDVYQARGTLNSVASDFPLEHYRLKAKEKLMQIDQILERKKSESISSKDSLIIDN